MLTYAQTLESLYARAAGGIKLGLEPTRALLKACNNPEHGLEHVVIVAGTNGKGSTARLIATALGLEHRGIGFFCSPHLLRFVDRIQIDLRPIAEELVVELYDQICKVEKSCPAVPTFFECTTVMAALAYARAGVKIAVIEVGLGGRLDATNVLDKDLAVITPIGLDHQKILGETIEAIAFEKAAVIPEHGAVVSAAQVAAARDVIAKVARERDARLTVAASSRLEGEALQLAGGGLEAPLSVAPWRLPPYQADNVATAAVACQELARLGLLSSPKLIERAVAAFDWPGRYQWIEGHPPLLLDGAHNPHAMTALTAAMDRDPRLAGRPIHAVFTALNDKSAEEMLQILKPRLASLHLTPVASRRTRSEAELHSLAPDAQVHPSPAAAITAACREAGANGVVLVTGSLFLVGAGIAHATGSKTDPSVDG
ncbi:MAG: bifunctional folylpolyglutamate synthase/dihydrofolate synthase [Deltaproteobacteria bacterium]|nr:bifunctional folylpolyglutamate synthase/dihydrofolate synthase [Deltaproteobacteria bacterium]